MVDSAASVLRYDTGAGRKGFVENVEKDDVPERKASSLRKTAHLVDVILWKRLGQLGKLLTDEGDDFRVDLVGENDDVIDRRLELLRVSLR